MKKTDVRKVAIWIVLLLGFLLSQNITWRIINSFYYNEVFGEKFQYFFQIEGACIYTFFAVYYTSDRQKIEKFVAKVPIVRKIFMLLVTIVTYFFVYVVKMFFLLPALFDTRSIRKEIQQIHKDAKQELEEIKHGPFVVRVVAGIGGVTILVLVISGIFKLEVIQCIADVANMVLNVVVFFIVCANVEVLPAFKPCSTNRKRKKWLFKYKYVLLLFLLIVLWILIPPFITLMMNTEPVFLSEFFGYVDSENCGAWIEFYGALIGGIITLVGVAWTIIDQNQKRKEDVRDSAKPILVASACTTEKVKQCGDGRVFECILEYKNVGKGILYNPRVFNIEYFVDNKIIGKLHPTLSVDTFIDINSTSDNDIMIEFSPQNLSEINASLKGRGNVVSIQIVMYVGGKDIYGRDIVSRLEYKSSLSFFSVTDIQVPLHSGELTSRVLFDEEEIKEVVLKANIPDDGDAFKWLEHYQDMHNMTVTLFSLYKFVNVNYLQFILVLLEDKSVIFREILNCNEVSGERFMLSFSAMVALYKLGFPIEQYKHKNIYITDSTQREILSEAEDIIARYKKDCVATMGKANGEVFFQESVEEEKQKWMSEAAGIRQYCQQIDTMNNEKDIKVEEFKDFDWKDFLGVCDYDAVAISMNTDVVLVNAEVPIMAISQIKECGISSVGIVDFLCDMGLTAPMLLDYIRKMIDCRFNIIVTDKLIKTLTALYENMTDVERDEFLLQWSECLRSVSELEDKYKENFVSLITDIFKKYHDESRMGNPIWRCFALYVMRYNNIKLQFPISE